MSSPFRALRHDQAGFTLIEVLVAATTSLIVFAATLTVFTGAERARSNTIEHNERQREARTAVDRITRDLRNLASPTDFGTGAGTAPLGVDRNGRYDLIYKTVDGVTGATATNQAAVSRVRYCLDTSSAGNAKLIQQQQPATAYTAAPPADTACPGAGWPGTPRLLAEHIVNAFGGGDRPIFTYSTDATLLPYDQPAALTNTTRVDVRLILDAKPGNSPVEAQLSSSVLLRNQNRPPTAVFRATVTGRSIQLNGSESDDPEHQPMRYDWYRGTEAADDARLPHEPGQGGVIFTLTDQPPGQHTFVLQVTDSAGTSVLSAPVTVTVT